MNKRKIPMALVLTTALAIAAIVAIVCVRLILAPSVVAPGAGVRFDDFTFDAGAAVMQTNIGKVQAAPGKAFYLVTAKMLNEAKRVDYTFRPAEVS